MSDDQFLVIVECEWCKVIAYYGGCVLYGSCTRHICRCSQKCSHSFASSPLM
uniref:Uncharacterized protein n=1 Tax=Arundo donax TaxID=35708 RepID=A0A0A9TAH6_ARUDO